MKGAFCLVKSSSDPLELQQNYGTTKWIISIELLPSQTQQNSEIHNLSGKLVMLKKGKQQIKSHAMEIGYSFIICPTKKICCGAFFLWKAFTLLIIF